jgi:hypothetical protein
MTDREPLTVPRQPHLVIAAARWWTPAPPAGNFLGAVLVHDTLMETVKAYLGQGAGYDTRDDMMTISEWGAKLDPDLGRVMFPAWAVDE